ncbi:hypothetical protein LB503_009208 [Fusarium chuoi]|nr:hypothetical protein LB503_009208 [Fusarium chuoi]
MAKAKDSLSFSGKVSKFRENWDIWKRRQLNERGGDRNVLCDTTSPTYIREALTSLADHLPTVSVDELVRAFSITQNINYYAVPESSENPMPNDLTEDEKQCIRDERERSLSLLSYRVTFRHQSMRLTYTPWTAQILCNFQKRTRFGPLVP